MTIPTTDPKHIALITGPSGAGRSTAINALEDLGFEVIDNIPLSLIPRLIDGEPLSKPLALSVDVRNRDFSLTALRTLKAKLTSHPELICTLVYLDSRAEVLERRYSETRRRHPLSPDTAPQEGILRELSLVQDIKEDADILIDTSDLTVHDLRASLRDWFVSAGATKMAISLQSFSYKRGLPQGLDSCFDLRFLRNPHWEPKLRALTGQDAAVQNYVKQDSRFPEAAQKIAEYLDFVLPAHVEEGKAHVSVGFGCTGGQHRSVTMAESIQAALAERGWQVSLRHRELERRNLLQGSENRTTSHGKRAQE